MSLKNEAENAVAFLRCLRDKKITTQQLMIDLPELIDRLEAATGTKDGMDVTTQPSESPRKCAKCGASIGPMPVSCRYCSQGDPSAMGTAELEIAPIPMILLCPRRECRMTHIDRPEPEKGWLNPPHKTHICHHCGHLWRPANVPTTGVPVLPKV